MLGIARLGHFCTYSSTFYLPIKSDQLWCSWSSWSQWYIYSCRYQSYWNSNLSECFLECSRPL